MGGSPFYDPFPSSSSYSPPSRPRPPRSVFTIPVSYRSSPSPLPRLPTIHPSAAATTIQSRFRGFSVRRRTPLVHLRTVASVERQLDPLRSELERSDFATAIRGNEKRRLKFTERIMALLLQLDAVEGAIPDIRNRRKQATRKAIQLQDAIDAISQKSEQEPELVQEFGDAVADDGKNAQIISGAADDKLIDTDAISQESEQELEVVQEFGSAIVDDGKNAEVLSGAADDKLVDLAQTAGLNSPALSVDLINSEKTFCLVNKLANDCATAADRSRTCDARMDAMLQGMKREEMATPQASESCIADENDSEEIRRFSQQIISARPAHFVNLESNHRVEKMWEDNCTTEDDRGGAKVSGDHSLSAIGDDAGNHDVKGRSVHLCTFAGQRAEECTAHDRTKRAGEFQRTNKNREIERLKIGACEEAPLSSGISIQNVSNVENGSASNVPALRAIESFASDSLPQEDKPRVPDKVLLEQLSEDCKHMKCLLTRLYDQSRMQNKIIDSLNNKVERLEHLAHRQQTKNRNQTCAKHNHRRIS